MTPADATSRRTETPEQAMERVTKQMVARAARLARKHGRTITISKTAKGAGRDVRELDPATPEGRAKLQAFLTPVARHYTIAGLGAPEDPGSVNWRVLNLPFPRRMMLVILVGITFLMKGTPFKNRVYRFMGAHIGRNVEIMQLAWLDHFRPELIFIGDNTLVGAYTRFTVHAYEGQGRFRYGIIEIGRECLLGAGTGVGPLKMEEGVRTLPGTTLSPYLVHVKAGAVVGFTPPPIRLPDPVPAVTAVAGEKEEIA